MENQILSPSGAAKPKRMPVTGKKDSNILTAIPRLDHLRVTTCEATHRIRLIDNTTVPAYYYGDQSVEDSIKVAKPQRPVYLIRGISLSKKSNNRTMCAVHLSPGELRRG
jgi:hypothetical protein